MTFGADNLKKRPAVLLTKEIRSVQKLWNLRPYDKINGETTKIPRLMVPCQEARTETEDWRDYRRLPEEITEFPLIRRMLLGADSIVHTPMLRAFQTNERRMAKFSESMDPWFVGRNAAVLQYTQFAYAVELARRRMSNAVTPKPRRFQEKGANLDLAPTVMRSNADFQEAALIVMSVKPELATSGETAD